MTDFSFDLKPAKKEAIPALISLWGPQGCGKTLSALLLARGLVGTKGKIAVVDTENGRALFYADRAGGWLHLDLQPPFTPERYSAAFRHCRDHGASIIVVDSASHVWQGEGGVLEKAEATPGFGIQKWKAPKIEHVKMMNDLTRSPVPVIFCIRAKDAVKQVKNAKGETEIISVGWVPICEKNLPYEMTIDLRMTKDGKYDLVNSKSIPDALRGVIVEGGVVNELMGERIAAWCGAGEQKKENIPDVVKYSLTGKRSNKDFTDIMEWKSAVLTTLKKFDKLEQFATFVQLNHKSFDLAMENGHEPVIDEINNVMNSLQEKMQQPDEVANGDKENP